MISDDDKKTDLGDIGLLSLTLGILFFIFAPIGKIRSPAKKFLGSISAFFILLIGMIMLVNHVSESTMDLTLLWYPIGLFGVIYLGCIFGDRKE